jgi:bifunctional non-homologous end joining protein LigD
MSLRVYARKRNFRKTTEPKARLGPASKSQRFVIQKHAASRLHYDFRLEINGTLKSWAVPKGIPFAKGEKRLAVQVEDHPVSYIDFEGTIPKGQYGGGTVMVWDRGTFVTSAKSPAQELAAGKLHFSLSGQKLHGEWYLVRLRDNKQWLLIRGGSNLHPVSKKLDDTSALSSKTMKELSEGNRVWSSSVSDARNGKPSSNGHRRNHSPRPSHLKFIEPMKARLVDAVPSGDWIFEIKFDGFRAMALKTDDEISLLSRNEKDLGIKFPEVVSALASLPVREAIIDGEIVALDSQGRSSFQLLQGFASGRQRPPIFFYAFDLLRLNGKDLRSHSLSERKSQLAKILQRPVGVIRLSASLGNNVEKLLKEARKIGLEGLIGKRVNSVYEAGQRSGAWIKLKIHQEQEFVIGGYTNPEGSRKYFGALLIGYNQGGKLKFAGKVGTGFDRLLLRTLYSQFKKINRANCPFANLPETRTNGRAQRMTATEMKRCHWVEPCLVCQLRFSEWTDDGKLRQPVFLGIREDKDAEEVVRETPR